MLIIYEIPEDLKLHQRIPCQSAQLEFSVFDLEKAASDNHERLEYSAGKDVHAMIEEQKEKGRKLAEKIVNQGRDTRSLVEELSRRYAGVITDLNSNHGHVIFPLNAGERILREYFGIENQSIY